MDTNEFNSTFWITISGLTMGFISAMGIYFLKSKCVKCSVCWGLIEVERDANAENDEEKMELEKGLNYTPQTFNADKH